MTVLSKQEGSMKVEGLETLTCLEEQGSIKKYESFMEVLEEYVTVVLENATLAGLLNPEIGAAKVELKEPAARQSQC